jgi:Lrp/AsnC family transcriptional regulator, leucine-responsive regulatory protein
MNSIHTEPLDYYDSKILAELQRDARISMSELGRRVHLSQPAVTERVRKLELSGVIKGYHAVVDAARLGYGIRAMVRVGRCDYATVIKRIEDTPEVVNAFNLTGEDSWILEIAVQDVPHLDEVVSKFCLLTETSTSIILNVARENHPLLPAQQSRTQAVFTKVAARDSPSVKSRKKGAVAQ